MKLSIAFVGFFIMVLRYVKGNNLLLESIRDILFPRNPEVNRVRRMEDAKGDPYAVLGTMGIIEKYGYTAEEHNLTTTDGYNLVFFRISGSPKSPATRGKPVVFVQHGMSGSSDVWIFLGPDKGLGFILADAGYDVWLGNVRGNSYCRSNTNLSTADKDFWEFSWHEMATIDIPSMVDYALEFSGQKTLHFIGHSMGTTISFVLLSEMPEYNEKMRLVVALAPTGVWKYESDNIAHKLFCRYVSLMKQIANSHDIYDILAQTKYNAIILEMLCGNNSELMPLCHLLMTSLMGPPAKEFNYSIVPILAKYAPAGISIMQALHYGQCFNTGIFKKFDYGIIKNLKIYGKKKPPIYNLSKISAPFALIYGQTDALSNDKNSIATAKLLKNVVTCEAVPDPYFNHLDFLLSSRVKDQVYDRIIELLSEY